MSKLNGKYQGIRLILGDQLNANHSWFNDNKPDYLYVIAELHQETSYTKHHVQKVCAFLRRWKTLLRRCALQASMCCTSL